MGTSGASLIVPLLRVAGPWWLHAVAGRGGLACAPGWTGALKDEFLGQVLLSSQNPLLGTEALL